MLYTVYSYSLISVITILDIRKCGIDRKSLTMVIFLRPIVLKPITDEVNASFYTFFHINSLFHLLKRLIVRKNAQIAHFIPWYDWDKKKSADLSNRDKRAIINAGIHQFYAIDKSAHR